MKGIIYLGNSKNEIERFSLRAKQRVITALTAISAGINLTPYEFKYMATVGPGVYELRIKVEKQYRVFYVAKFEEAIYILHAFEKKTQQTPTKEIQLGVSRYKALVNQRTGRKL
jgi:phage-related protein